MILLLFSTSDPLCKEHLVSVSRPRLFTIVVGSLLLMPVTALAQCKSGRPGSTGMSGGLNRITSFGSSGFTGGLTFPGASGGLTAQQQFFMQQQFVMQQQMLMQQMAQQQMMQQQALLTYAQQQQEMLKQQFQAMTQWATLQTDATLKTAQSSANLMLRQVAATELLQRARMVAAQ
jgi:hypothetical protein